MYGDKVITHGNRFATYSTPFCANEQIQKSRESTIFKHISLRNIAYRLQKERLRICNYAMLIRNEQF